MSKTILKLSAVLFWLGCSLALQAQNITGTVKDAKGEPVVGAFVQVQGTTTGTSTDLDGKYVIKVDDASKAVLEFSMIGMAKATQPVQGRTVVDVTLAEDTTFLDEVVVVGYATVKRRDLLGSVSSINSDKLVEQPVTTVSQALSGKMAGVAVTTTEGDPDAEIKIRVRGGGSITQDSSPLYIVDGFPVDNINDISSSEIASIDVLKDAFSTAIYGSRGANGVVIVTTKGAEKGRKVSVKFNTYYGQKWMANKNAIKVMDSENYVKAQYEQTMLAGDTETKYEPYFGSFADIDLYTGLPTNDWVGAVFGNTGSIFNLDFAVSGSGENYNWTLGYAHMGDNAIMMNSNYKRDNLNFKGQFRTSKRTAIDVNLRYSNTNINGAGANSINDSGTTSGNGRLKHAVMYAPIPVTSTQTGVEEEDFGDNAPPLRSVSDNDARKLRTNWVGNAAFSWDIIDDLKLKIEGGLEDYRQTENKFAGMTTYFVYNTNRPGPAAFYTDITRKKYRNTNTLNYDFQNVLNNDDHKLTAMIGSELTIMKSNTYSSVTIDFPTSFTSEKAWNFMGIGTPSSVNNLYNADDKMLSFFGRVNYDFKHRYSIGASLRTDGSSKFARGNRWGFFPSAAVSWTISNEPWMQSASDAVTMLKLRYSFGTAGNNNIPSGQMVKTFESGNANGNKVSDWIMSNAYYVAGKTMENPDLKWETTYTHNIGIDFGFWKGRINGSVEVYQNDTKDLLINFPIPGSGYESQYRNIGSTRNRGVELTLNLPLIQEKDYSLNVSGNISYNQNKIMSLGGLSRITGRSVQTYWASTEIGDDFYVAEGESLGTLYGFEYDGIYTTDDFNFTSGGWTLKEGVVSNPYVGKYLAPGSIKLKDLDGSGTIDEKDKTNIGCTMPKIQGGFALNAYIKGFDISANFNYVLGNKIYNANKAEFTTCRKYNNRNYLDMMNVDNRWTSVDWNTGATFTTAEQFNAANAGKTQFSPYAEKAIFSNWAVEDGSFLRLQSLTLGYTLPEKWTSKIWMRKLRIYVTGTNLFCLTKYSGYDPEVDSRRTYPLTPGVDYSAYPKSIGYVAGLNITF